MSDLIMWSNTETGSRNEPRSRVETTLPHPSGFLCLIRSDDEGANAIRASLPLSDRQLSGRYLELM